ncbi:hypothetical protein BMS_1760 [Halobacteriovorax marinus SJ]|uniref:PKD domain-containing protein n=1 Tax=Halobacteriovorax marinus (strain ATCC BAA-682 / DSM 15412 / SJ) TaxID=862908 RepID=E1X1S7_HALMS|nr:PKD domain-containing protein [Halobacteriovorax marinus]CBW26587.1 hypothetical protein BMS_1760 [Halobacteriovorax marinus SJ]
MNVGRLLFIALFFINSSYALECQLPSGLEGITCNKNKRVKSLTELNNYLVDYNSVSGVAKNLIIDFDINLDTDLNIFSPCKVRFAKNRSFTSTGNLCVNAKEGVYFNPYFTLRANEVALHSTKRVVIRNNADVEVRKLVLQSLGATPEARVHIRHHSTIKADSLELFGEYRATLGHSSNYEVSSDIYMKSINEFASIWRDTVVTTPSLEIESERKVVVSKNVQINSAQISLEAPECKLNTLVQNESMSGNCFSSDRPSAKLRVSSREVSVLEEVTFNANRSSDNIGIENYEFIVNGEVSQSGSNPIFKKSFDSEGIYKVQLLVRDASGYIDSAVKKITVNNSLDSDMEAFFHYEVEDGELSLVYHQGLPIEDVISMKYIINDSTEVNVSEFYHLTSTEVAGLSEGNHKVTLELVDINNVKYIFSRIVTVGPEEVMRQVLPVVDFDIYQVAPKKAFLDFRKSFEPYDGIEEVEIDWGDGTTSEVDAESLTSFFHTYSNVGEYEVTLLVNKEIGDDEWIQKEAIKTVVVTDSDVPSMPPIADFKADVEEFAPHVTFSSNFSVSPTSEIVSTVWDHGDGTSYSGSDKEHIHFYTPGVYLPSLTVVDSNGLISKLTMKVVVSEPGPPVISSIDCWNQDERWVECEIIAVDKEDEITELEISWGDGEAEIFNMD